MDKLSDKCDFEKCALKIILKEISEINVYKRVWTNNEW